MGKFILFQKENQQYYWRLEASNYEPICHSEVYNSKQAALLGIEACRKLSSDGRNYHLFQGNDFKHYWNLKGLNNHIVCQSQGYTAKQSAEKGIDSCKVNAPTSLVEEKSLVGA